jgi:hypothetical protein
MELSDDDLRDAAMGLRALAHIAESDAAKTQNPSVRDAFLEQSRKYRALAQRFEDERQLKSIGASQL